MLRNLKKSLVSLRGGFTQHHFSRQKVEAGLPSTTFTHRNGGVDLSSTTFSIRKSGAGFTMIELLVAMVLFVTIVSMVSVIFITSIRAERQIVALIAANDNTFQALEQMSRAIRVGRSFNIPSPAEMDFLNPQGERIHYRHNGSALEWAVGDSSLLWKKFTADNVKINSFEIRPRGERPNDFEPARITLILSVGAKGAPNVENIFTHIQTTTTVRNLDQ